MKLSLAAGAAIALVLGGVSPAFAANVHVAPDQIAPYEVGGVGTEAGFNYDQWHIGSERAGTHESLSFGECSVTLNQPSAGAPSWVQVMKGFPVDERPRAATGGSLEEISALLNAISLDVATGTATIQVPIFTGVAGQDKPNFTTLTSSLLEAGPGSFGDAPVGFSGTFPAVPQTLTEYLAGLQAQLNDPTSGLTYVEILGVGFNGNEGASVNSLSFAGDTHFFGTADCGPVAPVVPETPGASTPVTKPTPPAKIETAA